MLTVSCPDVRVGRTPFSMPVGQEDRSNWKCFAAAMKSCRIRQAREEIRMLSRMRRV